MFVYEIKENFVLLSKGLKLGKIIDFSKFSCGQIIFFINFYVLRIDIKISPAALTVRTILETVTQWKNTAYTFRNEN